MVPIYIGKGRWKLWRDYCSRDLLRWRTCYLKLLLKLWVSNYNLRPHCEVGGEVNNSVIFGYSNKGHEGFLGNSVIGGIGGNLGKQIQEIRIWRKHYVQWVVGTIYGSIWNTGPTSFVVRPWRTILKMVSIQCSIPELWLSFCQVFAGGFPWNTFQWCLEEAKALKLSDLEKAFEVGQRRMESQRNSPRWKQVNPF